MKRTGAFLLAGILLVALANVAPLAFCAGADSDGLRIHEGICTAVDVGCREYDFNSPAAMRGSIDGKGSFNMVSGISVKKEIGNAETAPEVAPCDLALWSREQYTDPPYINDVEKIGAEAHRLHVEDQSEVKYHALKDSVPGVRAVAWVSSAEARGAEAAASYASVTPPAQAAGPQTGDGMSLDTARFPDPVFLEYMSRNDVDGDGVLSQEELEALEYVILDHRGIASLQGIEYLTHMKMLDCSGNDLESLDLTGCTELENLYCADNHLAELDVSPCPRLLELDCSGNLLTRLTVDGCKKLRWLVCSDNKLNRLRLDENSELNGIYCYGNYLERLDICRCPRLEEIALPQYQKTITPESMGTDWGDDAFVYYGETGKPGYPGIGIDGDVLLITSSGGIWLI